MAKSDKQKLAEQGREIGRLKLLAHNLQQKLDGAMTRLDAATKRPPDWHAKQKEAREEIEHLERQIASLERSMTDQKERFEYAWREAAHGRETASKAIAKYNALMDRLHASVRECRALRNELRKKQPKSKIVQLRVVGQ